MVRVSLILIILFGIGCDKPKENGSELPQDGESAPVTSYPDCDAVNYARTCEEEDGTIVFVPQPEN